MRLKLVVNGMQLKDFQTQIKIFKILLTILY